MKKLKLDLDALAVESFEADAREGQSGTVAAHVFTAQCGGTNVCTVSCHADTCYASCNGNSCISCYGTCPKPCEGTGGFYSECCSNFCTPYCATGSPGCTIWEPTCGEACTQVCP